jgi:signal transduction histidine kinase
VRLPAPERRPLDLRALLADLHTLFRPELVRRRIEWTWEAEADLPPLSADKNQIEQVLVNVLKNAYESIGEDGEIRVSLRRDEVRSRLAISDTGAGLSPESRAAIFTPFFTTKRDGRGLGLTIVSEILTAHGFTFGLVPREGGGATFWIVL